MSDSQTTVVHLMRHGEVFNPGGVLYGRLPGYHLSELGRQMADVVAESFRGQHAIIEKNVQRSVKIQSDPQLMWEDYKIILE